MMGFNYVNLYSHVQVQLPYFMFIKLKYVPAIETSVPFQNQLAHLSAHINHCHITDCVIGAIPGS